MLQRRLVIDTTSGLVIVVFLGLLFWAAVSITNLNAAYSVSEHYRVDSKENNSDDAILAFCSRLPDLNRIQCAINEARARQNRTNEAEGLQAQKRIALWSKFMFFTSLFASAAAVFGLVWLRATWAETKRTADVARDIGEKQVRAYLSVKSISIDDKLSTTGRVVAHMTYENTGQSPARNVHHELQVGCAIAIGKPNILFEDIVSELTEVRKQQGSSTGEIGSRGTGICKVQSDDPVPPNFFNLVSSGKAIIFVRGWVIYSDVFGARHQVMFCWHRDAETARQGFNLSLSPSGNSAD